MTASRVAPLSSRKQNNKRKRNGEEETEEEVETENRQPSSSSSKQKKKKQLLLSITRENTQKLHPPLPTAVERKKKEAILPVRVSPRLKQKKRKKRSTSVLFYFIFLVSSKRNVKPSVEMKKTKKKKKKNKSGRRSCSRQSCPYCDLNKAIANRAHPTLSRNRLWFCLCGAKRRQTKTSPNRPLFCRPSSRFFFTKSETVQRMKTGHPHGKIKSFFWLFLGGAPSQSFSHQHHHHVLPIPVSFLLFFF